MAIDPKLVSITPASDLPTGVPTSEGQFFFFEGNVMKKAPMTDIYDKVSAGVKGVAIPSTVPSATGFERYLVHTAGTYPNFGGIIVTAADLDVINGVANNRVILEVNNGVATKIVERVKGDVGEKGEDGKTIEAYSEDALYVAGSQIFFEGKIYQTTADTVAGENPTNNPNKFTLVFEAVQRSILAPIEGEPSDEIGKVGQNIIATVDGFDWLYTKELSGWVRIYQLTHLGNGFYKSKNGLIENTDLSDWELPPTYSVAINPTYISWGKLGEKIGQKGVSDAMGRREGHLFIDDDGKWYLYYGSSANTASGWRVQLDVSDDEGLTWRKKGDTSIGLQDGRGGSYPARDMLFMNKFDGVYYIYPMTAASLYQSICYAPYFSDVWKYTGNDLENATWEYVRYQLEAGATAYTQGGAYTGSVVRNPTDNTFVNFFSGNRTVDTYNVGIGTLPTPDGIVDRAPQPLLEERPDYIIENPKVFYSVLFSKWVMINNTGTKSSGKTSQNMLLFSDDLLEWDYENEVYTSNTSPLDGRVAVGIHSPIYKPNGEVVQTSDGRIPLTFDSLDSSVGSIYNHTNRDLWYTIFEPSLKKLQRSIPPLYSDEFYQETNAEMPLTTYNSKWSIIGDATFMLGVKGTDFYGNIRSQGGLSVAVYDRVILNNQTIICNLGEMANSANGMVFNFQNADNYEFIHISTVIGHYKRTNGTNTLITQLSTTPISSVLNAIILTVFDNNYYLMLATKTKITEVKLGELIAGTKAGLLHDAGTAYFNSFEIIDRSFMRYGQIQVFDEKSYDFSTATHLMPANQFSPDFAITKGMVQIYNSGSVKGIYFPNAGEAILMLNNRTSSLLFKFALNGSIGLIYNYQDENNFRMLDIMISTQPSVFYINKNGIFSSVSSALKIPAGEIEVTAVGELKVNNVEILNLLGFNPEIKKFGFRNGSGGGNRIETLSTEFKGAVDTTDVYFGHDINGNAVVANGVFEFSAYNAYPDASPLIFRFRVQDEQNYYYISIGAFSHFILGRVINGVRSVSAYYSNPHKLISNNNPIRVRVVLNGENIKVFVNGEKLEAKFSYFSSGTYGFKTYFSKNEIRNFRFYFSEKITILGTTAGSDIVIRSAGVPVYKGVGNSKTTEVALSHYPVDEIVINGISKKFESLIWGGDVITFNI